MIPTVFTIDGKAYYYNFPPPTFGHWSQAIKGSYPYYITLGGFNYHYIPSPHGTQFTAPQPISIGLIRSTSTCTLL